MTIPRFQLKPGDFLFWMVDEKGREKCNRDFNLQPNRVINETFKPTLCGRGQTSYPTFLR